jgi:hypothetical protein
MYNTLKKVVLASTTRAYKGVEVQFHVLFLTRSYIKGSCLLYATATSPPNKQPILGLPTE